MKNRLMMTMHMNSEVTGMSSVTAKAFYMYI